MFVADLRYAVRSVLRARGFALAVVVTLGLGIGATTAIFSVVRGVMLKPLPHREGDRLMYLRQSIRGPGGEDIAFSVPEIADFRTGSKTLAGIAEYSPITLTLVGDNDAVRIDVGLVTGNYFSVMGLSPVLGRSFTEGDDGKSAAPVMMLTYDYWQKRFGGDRAVVGRTLRVAGKAVTVVGVLQPAPYFPARIDALMNMVNSEHHLSAMMVTGRTHRMTAMIARLAPGASVEQARAEVAAITARAHADHPEAYDAGSGFQVTLTPFKEVLGQGARLTLMLLMGAAAFVLIIACANVANLTLMRGVRREQELVVRAALGAGAARLRRLLLAENLVLAVAGSILGLLIAFGGLRMLATFAARYSPRANEIRIDGVVLAFSLLLAIVVAVLLSFAPGLASERALGASLSAGGRRTTGTVRRQRLQQALVVAQIAVSMMLLTGAGLLTRTMQRLSVVDSGMSTEHVLTMEVPKDFDGSSPVAAIAQYEQMQSELAALPGVSEVGVGSTMPLRVAGIMLDIKADGHPVAPGQAQPHSEYRTANPDYFHAAGIPLLHGRAFTSTDRAGSPRVVILNKTLADQFFPNQDPIGQRVAWTGDVLKFIGVSDDWRTVVGVVGDTKDGGLDASPIPVTFIPFAQGDFPSGGFVIRTKTNAASLAAAATRVVRQAAPQQPIEKVLTVEQIRDESVAPRRLNAMLVSSFGILAMIVAAVGIAGVLAFSVSARTNEIGVRMSLGADSRMVQRMVLSEGGRLVLIGLALGVVGALSLTRLMQGLLFGVPPHDPVTLIIVALIMAVVGIGACWIPAFRAAQIDPAVALRAG
ncbi:MAG TPA: ABC transporter permease [Gemmatimonadaceae bacterium]|jgi:predicted permease|nr:ABC transporter permease [Gemmatimonadaceae bacterium]